MVKAIAVSDPMNEEVSRAGDAMMLLISRSTWEVLKKQSVSEDCEPGAILSKALSDYIENHGSAEAKSYLARLGGARRG